MRHASNFNGFTLEILACPDATRKSPSPIYREISRITFHDRELPDYDGYYSTLANDLARERRCRLRKLRPHPDLREEIISQLKARWSSEQIAERLVSDGVSLVRVCKETIYRFIYNKEDLRLRSLSGLWKMGWAHPAGSAIPVHPGKKARSRTPTSVFVAIYPAIPI